MPRNIKWSTHVHLLNLDKGSFTVSNAGAHSTTGILHSCAYYASKHKIIYSRLTALNFVKGISFTVSNNAAASTSGILLSCPYYVSKYKKICSRTTSLNFVEGLSFIERNTAVYTHEQYLSNLSKNYPLTRGMLPLLSLQKCCACAYES